MRIHPFLLALALVPALTNEGQAQRPKVGREWHEDSHNGYRFRYPHEWRVTPVQESTKEFGVIARISGPILSTKLPGNKAGNVGLFLSIFAFKQKAAVTRKESEGTGGLRDLIDGAGASRQKVKDFLPRLYSGLRDLQMSEEEEGKTPKKIPWHRETYDAFTGDFDIRFDTFTFRLDDRDIVLTFGIPKQHFKKWERTMERCVNTFQIIPRTAEIKIEDHTDYASVLAAARDETRTVSGWEVIEVPSKRYIIKTSSKDKRFLKELVTRLEKSRDLFERDFPPSKAIAHISIVRVCKDRQEFSTYGEVPNGVVGFFSPTSTELVVVDYKEINRAITWSTVTHEAFHQYCHFLFDESEAHRWYDEGHGDYYGYFEFKGKKAIPGYRRGGRSRLEEIKPLVKAETFTPIAELLRMDHPSWQRIYTHYAQSWSVIYMLRRGMDGDVHRRYWKREYEMIIPNYVRTLHRGFLDAYEVIRLERIAEAKLENREPTEEELNINRFDLRQAQKEKIWDQALANSWGQIDLDQFQQDWVGFILKGVD